MSERAPDESPSDERVAAPVAAGGGGGWSPLKIAVISIVSLVGAAVVFIIIAVILVFVGGPDLDAECGDRLIDPAGHTDAAFDAKWEAFDDEVGAGVAAGVVFDEAELTQRVQSFLIAENVEEIKDVIICLFADGVGEGRGQIDVPGFPDINAKITGQIDLAGVVPVFDIEDFDVGSAGFIVNAFGAKGEVEDGVNLALEEIDLQHPPYQIVIEEGRVTISGG
jgi:hypothetical protein